MGNPAKARARRSNSDCGSWLALPPGSLVVDAACLFFYLVIASSPDQDSTVDWIMVNKRAARRPSEPGTTSSGDSLAARRKAWPRWRVASPFRPTSR